MRIADRMVAAHVLAWIVLTGVGALGLGWLMGSIEADKQDLGAALAGSLLRVPALILPLGPLLCSLGAGLAAARQISRGERLALELCGLGPWRTARAAAAAGLLVGTFLWFAAAFVMPVCEAAAIALRPPAPGWIWMEGAAVRESDGLSVRARDGQLGAPERLDATALSGEAIRLARMQQHPRTASASALVSAPYRPARVEAATRLARIFACGLLAVLGWLPLAASAPGQVGRALMLGLAWQLADLALQNMGSQGALPVAAGAWGAICALALGLLLARVYWSRTWSILADGR